MSTVHNGVLIPDDMRDATPAELDAYAERVRVGNAKFVADYFAMIEAAEAAVRAGDMTTDELDRLLDRG